MNFLFTAVSFVIALGVLITFHELGHYLVARLANVKVLRFSVGFGRPVWKKTLGGDQTEWVIGAIPLGGYVKMLDEREVDVAPAEQQRAFNRQSPWRRFAITIAGPLANFLLAIAVFSALFIHGVQELVPIIAEPPAQTAAADAGLARGDKILKINDEEVATWQEVRWRLLQFALARTPVRLEVTNRKREISWHRLDVSHLSADDLDGDILRHLGLQLYPPEIPPVIASVTPGGVAEHAGLLPGDRIRSVNDIPVEWWDQVVNRIRQSPGVAMDIEVDRGSQRLDITLRPEAYGDYGARIGRIGAAPYFDAETMRYNTVEIRYGPLESVPKAVEKTWDTSVFSLKMLGKMLTGVISWRNISGPVTIADYAGQSARLGLAAYLNFLAFISISIGVLNLLPIPILDGGNLMYYVVEIVRGRPVSERVLEIGQQVGLCLLCILMAFAFYNDISRLISS